MTLRRFRIARSKMRRRSPLRPALGFGAANSAACVLALSLLIGSSCTRARPADRSPLNGPNPQASTPGSVRPMKIGDTANVGGFGVTVTATRTATGPAFGIARMPRPPKGAEWLIVDVDLKNRTKDSVDIESLVFKARGAGSRQDRKPAQVLISTGNGDLDSTGVVRAGGRIAMSLAFVVPRTKGPTVMTFAVTGRRDSVRYLVK